MLVVSKVPKIIVSALSAKVGAAIWRNLSSETKWRLIKVNTAIVSKVAARTITHNPKKIALVVLAGTIIGAILLFGNKKL